MNSFLSSPPTCTHLNPQNPGNASVPTVCKITWTAIEGELLWTWQVNQVSEDALLSLRALNHAQMQKPVFLFPTEIFKILPQA